MGIVNISDMKCETAGEKNFTPVTKSSIFKKTEQTTTVNDAMETKIEIGI